MSKLLSDCIASFCALLVKFCAFAELRNAGNDESWPFYAIFIFLHLSSSHSLPLSVGIMLCLVPFLSFLSRASLHSLLTQIYMNLPKCTNRYYSLALVITCCFWEAVSHFIRSLEFSIDDRRAHNSQPRTNGLLSVSSSAHHISYVSN